MLFRIGGLQSTFDKIVGSNEPTILLQRLAFANSYVLLHFEIQNIKAEGWRCFMKSKRTTEDYLKTIYVLSYRGEVRCCQLAESLSVSRPTVSVSVQALIKEGLVYMDEQKICI